MAKSNYLPGLLLLSFFGLCIGVGSDYLGSQERSQEPGAESQDSGSVLGDVSYKSSVDLKIDTAGSGFRPPSSNFSPLTSVPTIKTIYDSQIGVRETASNSGPEVDRYLRYVGLSKGNPWCAAFVCWVLGEAGVENPRTGWSPGLFPDHRVIWEKGEQRTRNQESTCLPARQGLPAYITTANTSRLAIGSGQPAYRTGRLSTGSPNTGDIFGIYFPDKGRIAHVGFIDQWEGSWLVGVEGNTNISGSREGDGVYRKRRLVRSIYRVARYIK